MFLLIFGSYQNEVTENVKAHASIPHHCYKGCRAAVVQWNGNIYGGWCSSRYIEQIRMHCGKCVDGKLLARIPLAHLLIQASHCSANVQATAGTSVAKVGVQALHWENWMSCSLLLAKPSNWA